MSQPPFPPPPPLPPQGGGAGPPLVSMPPPPQAPGRFRASVTDHPLAGATAAASARSPPPSGGLPSSSSTMSPPLTPPTTTSGAAAATTFMAAATPKVFGLPPPVNQSLDAMADAFLSGDGTLQSPKLRPLPLQPSTNSELDRVRALVVRRAWGDVLSVVHNLLRGPHSHYTPIYASLLQGGPPEAVDSLDSLRDDVVELMMLQCHAWLKMRRYNELGHELRQWKFLNNNNDEATTTTTTTTTTTWIPFGVRCTASAAWQYIPPDLGGGHQRALDALHALGKELQNNGNSNTDSMDDQSAANAVTIEYLLANILCREKQWRMALQALDRLATYIPQVARWFAKENFVGKDDSSVVDVALPVLQAVAQCEVWSRQGRIFLQAGALEAAATLFGKAQERWESVMSSTTTTTLPTNLAQQSWVAKQVPAQVLYTNNGLLAFANHQYKQASEDFRKALTALQQNWSVDGSYRRQDWVGGWGLLPPQYQESLYAETMNNLSLAALYSCRLHDSIQVLESLIRTDPTCFLTERMALNLCTLYELSADTNVANRKKRTLQLIAKRFFLHDIGQENFRIGP